MTTVTPPPPSGYDGRPAAIGDDTGTGRAAGAAVQIAGPSNLAERARRARMARRAAVLLPLGLILLGQTILTMKLASWAYASGDEGRYIYAGHQLIYEMWHGGGSPYYETYFSGAPVVYPVMAAMADYVGGLLAVRLMSLVFMLIATCLLFDISRRWFGYWPGVLAAGLFAGIGLTQDLGALATYDALALMLVVAAAFCAARTGDGERQATRWLLAIPLVLLLANATKYVSVLFDPIVIGIAAWQVRGDGLRRVVQRLTALAVTTATLLCIGLLMGGRAYLQGITSSTFSRQASNPAFAGTATGQSGLSTRAVIEASWDWIGAVVVLGFLALLMAVLMRRNWGQASLLGLLLIAGILVTVEGVHLHSTESMYKHDDFGIWFTAAGAGSIVAWRRQRVAKIVLACALIMGSGFLYSRNAVATYQASNSSVTMAEFAALRPYLDVRSGRYLLGGLTEDDLIYEDQVPVQWFSLVDDLYIKYPIPDRGGDSHGRTQGVVCYILRPGCMYLEGIAGYRAAITAHWFSAISMVGEHYTAQDRKIEYLVASTPGYVRVWQVPGPPTWIYAPDYSAGSR
jgi:Dolichyl-phosphate-mannose-protein mannosyltransferase